MCVCISLDTTSDSLAEQHLSEEQMSDSDIYIDQSNGRLGLIECFLFCLQRKGSSDR